MCIGLRTWLQDAMKGRDEGWIYIISIGPRNAIAGAVEAGTLDSAPGRRFAVGGHPSPPGIGVRPDLGNGRGGEAGTERYGYRGEFEASSGNETYHFRTA